MKFLLVGVNSKFIHTNLALYYLSSYYEKNKKNNDNSEVIIKEYTINENTDFIIGDIYREKADVLFFSTYIWNISVIKNIVWGINRVSPTIPIWLGGPEITYSYDKYLEKINHNAYKNISDLNIEGIMIGEGEKSFLEIINAYNKNKTFSYIKNILYKEKNLDVKNLKYSSIKDNYIKNETTEFMDLDEVVFPYADLDYNNTDNNKNKTINEIFHNRILYYESSRGCPFSCKYCLSSIEKGVRLRSLKLIFTELKFFLDNRVKQVKFIDRTFNANKRHAIEILKFIKENDNGITNFHFEVAGDLFDEEILNIIKDMRCGLVQFEVGIQSTNEHTIKEVSRVTSFNKIKENVLKILSFKNSLVHLDLIAGLPRENLESFKKSFNDVMELNPSEFQLGFLKVLSGSLIDKEAKEYGIVYNKEAPYEIFYNKDISYDEILELKDIEDIIDNYYNSGQFINTFKALRKQYNSYYDMYKDISIFFRKNDYYKITPSREVKYERIYNYILSKDFSIEEKEIYKEVLIFDYYKREKAKRELRFSNGKVSFKEAILMEDKIKEIVNYKGNSIKDIYPLVHIEKMEMDVFSYLDRGVIIKKKTYVLYDYSGERDYMNNYKETEIK